MEGVLIEAALDYLLLERFAADSEFQLAWRGFTRACNHLLPDLLPEAKPWITAADEYDAGRLSEEHLSDIREQMSRSFSAMSKAVTMQQRAALSAAGHRLWPRLNPEGWHETAWYFLNWCATAGIGEPTLIELLRQNFGPFLVAKGISLQELATDSQQSTSSDGDD